MQLEGFSFQSTFDFLKNKNIKSKNGKTWGKKTVSRIIDRASAPATIDASLGLVMVGGVKALILLLVVVCVGCGTTSPTTHALMPSLSVSAAAGSWLDIAKTQLGVKELSGSRNNPRIVDYHRTTIDSARWKNGMPDSVDWCSSFVNWVVKKAGINGTNKGNARSWLSWGQRLNKPVPGCVVVFWRDSLSSWKGHVGFYVGEAGSHVKVLGGNQDNAVTISTYPKGRILGYRWPSNTPLPSH